MIGLIAKGSGCQTPHKRNPMPTDKAKSQINRINGNLEVKTPNNSHNALCY